MLGIALDLRFGPGLATNSCGMSGTPRRSDRFEVPDVVGENFHFRLAPVFWAIVVWDYFLLKAVIPQVRSADITH